MSTYFTVSSGCDLITEIDVKSNANAISIAVKTRDLVNRINVYPTGFLVSLAAINHTRYATFYAYVMILISIKPRSTGHFAMKPPLGVMEKSPEIL